MKLHHADTRKASQEVSSTMSVNRTEVPKGQLTVKSPPPAGNTRRPVLNHGRHKLASCQFSTCFTKAARWIRKLFSKVPNDTTSNQVKEFSYGCESLNARIGQMRLKFQLSNCTTSFGLLLGSTLKVGSHSTDQSHRHIEDIKVYIFLNVHGQSATGLLEIIQQLPSQLVGYLLL